MKQGTDPSPNKSSPKWSRRLKRLRSDVAEYLWQHEVKARVAPGWRFASRGWKLGWPLRSVLAAMLVLAAGAFLLGKAAPTPESQRGGLEVILLLLGVLAFGTVAATAAGWGAWSFALISPWMAYLGMGAASALAGTPWRLLIAFPVWALLLAGWRLCVAESRRGPAAFLWLLLAIGAGCLTSGLSGFRAALGLPWQSGGVLFGLLIAVAGGIAWWLCRDREWTDEPFGRVLTLTGGVLAGVLAVSMWQDRAGTVSWTLNQLPLVDFLATLFWFWSGGGFVFATWKLAERVMRRVLRMGLGRTLATRAPALWIAAAVLECLLVGAGTGLPGVDSWLYLAARALPLHFRLAARWHLVFTLLVLAMLAWWKHRRRTSPLRVIGLNNLWIVSFLALFAVASKLTAIASPSSAATATGVAVAASVMGALGILAHARKDWSLASDRHVALYAAWGCAFTAIVVGDQLSASWHLEQQKAVEVFEGMFTLGLPMAVYGGLTRHTSARNRAPALAQLAFVVLGMLLAMGVMWVEYTDWRWLLASIPVALPVLLAARTLWPSWNRPAGAMLGCMLAAGITLYWRLPVTFCVPFRSAMPSMEQLTLWYEARRALGLDGQLAVTMVGLAIGAACGWLLFFRRPAVLPDADA